MESTNLTVSDIDVDIIIKNMKNGNGKTGIFRYRSFREIANQWEYNSNCKTVEVLGINSSREWLI
jgi:hypothetical protein